MWLMNMRVKFNMYFVTIRSQVLQYLSLAVQGLWSLDDQVSPTGFLCSLFLLSVLNPTFSTGTTVTNPSAGIVILNYSQSKH